LAGPPLTYGAVDQVPRAAVHSDSSFITAVVTPV
jgi:hypothetical protein